MNSLSSTITTIKGIGDKTAKLFHRVGIHTVGELLSYYPRTYDCCEPPVSFDELEEGSIFAVTGTIRRPLDVKRVRQLQIVTTTLQENGQHLTLTWFNMPFLKNTLHVGDTFIFRGAISRKNGRLTMEHPEYFTPEAYEKQLHAMQPIYGLTAGLSNKVVTKAVRQALTDFPALTEYLPDEIRLRQRLADYGVSLQTIHFPVNRSALLEARRRLVFDEFFLFILALQRLKEKQDFTENTCPMKPAPDTEMLIQKLPYTLTGAQQKVWGEVQKDLCGHRTMARLIQGDVGSGKTIIAILAMIMAARNGYQSALMVPTEVLAKQHYESMCTLFAEQGMTFTPILLTGSMTAKQKREAYAQIQSGEAQMIVGTHALIQEKVQYQRLGLVITDEQHRFGVKQRETLSDKGLFPHILVMSATPIPRTLAIIVYGDLDISVIDELPAERLPIKNCVVDESFRKKAYVFIENEVAKGRQAYVICPMVEENEELEMENVIDYADQLRAALPSSITVAYLHGKMKPAEKNQIMEAFAANQIQVLVSTTVVEVGVNVPNASVMMVENAERFGLAQLHQLRGRVGRGRHQSYCIFISNTKNKDTRKRLEILNESNDGFYIASEDLKLRGPGDLFGVRQSGLFEFRIGDIFTDASVLQNASEEAKGILEQDPELLLPEHQALKKRLELYTSKHQRNGGFL